MKALVIIPAYNESKSIINVVKEIEKNKQNKEYKLDYIIINDGSTDNTKEICEENNFNVINLVSNLGIGGAVQTGYLYALKHHYDIAIQFDGDGQHDAKYIKDLVIPIINGEANMTIGSRYITDLSSYKSTIVRQIGIKFLSMMLTLLTKVKILDVTSGFRAVNKDIIEIFAYDYPSDYPEPESIVTVIKKGYKVAEIPVKMQERLYGKSSITPLKSIYYMIKVTYAMIMRCLIERK